MSKFCGMIGFEETVQTKPGVYVEKITEKSFYGDIRRNTRRLQGTEKVNEDLTLSNELSIVADPYLRDHFHSIRYVRYCGAKWRVQNVEEQLPRLILTFGGLYNG